MTRLLAFDTSTQGLSVALALPGQTLVHDGEGGAAASGQLIAQAQALLAQAGLVWAQLDAIAFGRGPGAFTGLRTACAVAQGLALGAGKPVLPVDSLMVVAQDACLTQGAPTMAGAAPSLWVATDARMGEAYAAQYRWQADGGGHRSWRVDTAPMLGQPEQLLERWAEDPPQGLAGNALLAFAEALSPAAAPLRDVPRFPHAQVRARALADVARQAWAQGAAVDAAWALPLYVRDKVAQTTAEREAVRGAASAIPVGRA